MQQHHKALALSFDDVIFGLNSIPTGILALEQGYQKVLVLVGNNDLVKCSRVPLHFFDVTNEKLT